MTLPQQSDLALAPRSSFVTVVAWIFIVLSGFSTLISALQNLMIRSMPMDMNAALSDSTTAGQMPAAARTMFANFPLIFLAFFILSLLTLVSAIGLLRRRNWARVAFIVVLWIGVAYSLAGIFLQNSMMSSFDSSFRGAASQDSTFRQSTEQLQSMFQAVRVFAIVFSLAIAGVFAWIAVKLASARIRAEFIPHVAA